MAGTGGTDPFVVRRDDTDPSPWQVLAGGERTGGLAVFGDAIVPARSAGPFLHVHSREDEAGFVVSGVMTFRVGDDVFEAGPGSLVWLPRATPHTFANRSDEPARILGMITPAGLEAMFEDAAQHIRETAGQPDEDVMREIGARYGVTRVGPPLDV